jgi:hypothetical protein
LKIEKERDDQALARQVIPPTYLGVKYRVVLDVTRVGRCVRGGRNRAIGGRRTSGAFGPSPGVGQIGRWVTCRGAARSPGSFHGSDPDGQNSHERTGRSIGHGSSGNAQCFKVLLQSNTTAISTLFVVPEGNCLICEHSKADNRFLCDRQEPQTVCLSSPGADHCILRTKFGSPKIINKHRKSAKSNF